MAFPKDNIYESIIKESNVSDGGYVQMEWNATEGGALAVGTACPIDGDYLLLSTYWPSQQSVRGYRYSVKFLHRLAQLDYLPFYFKTKAVTGVDEDGEVTYEDVVLSTYPYTGNLQTIAEALADCLSDHGDLGAWTADCGSLSSGVTASISFDGATVKSAAAAIADAFGTDYQFDWSGHCIRFGSTDGAAVTPGYGTGGGQAGGNGVTEAGGTLVSATDGGIQYNTFRILGGTKNMSKKTLKGRNVQVTTRLMLDDGSIMGGGSPKIMKDLVFDDIYPKMELWLYDVHERRCWLTDENGQKIVDSQATDPETGGVVTTYKQYSKWYFKLARWNGTELVPYVFDTSLIIEGLPLSMVFQANYADGALPQPLVGREFELTYFDSANPAREKESDDVDGGYQPVHGEYRIIFKVEGGMILPSTSGEKVCPYGDGMALVNNKVTLTNVAMDDVYKEAAKVELRQAGEEAVKAYSADKSSFTYLTYGAAPALGGGVTSVRQDLITGEVQYTVGSYQSSKGLIGRLSDKIDTISAGGGSGTTGDEGTSGRGGGVSESSIPLLSRLMGSGSVVKDSLTILKELILGTTGHGVWIDGNGDASMTIGSLTVLGTTHLSEIDVDHIRHTGGMMVVTKASIIVDHVEHLDGGLDKLYFRRVNADGQKIYNQFEVGDLGLMMVYNEALDGSINRYYWREVSAIDDGTEEYGYIVLLPSSASHSEPQAGDVVVQLGNTQKEERQGATVLGGSGPNGGFLAVYDGFKTWRDAAPKLDDYDQALTYISPKKNKQHGTFINVAGDDLQSQLDALQASLLSVRQQSDKQLVIWYGEDAEPYPASGHLDEWNDPAKDWHDADTAAGTTEQQELHLEDVYYLRRNNTTRKGGRAWQWVYDAALGRFLWVEITDADTIAALEAADDAVATANDAKQKVESLGDDGIISAGTEKSELLILWQDTVAEYVKYIEQAEDYELEKIPNGGEGVNIAYTPYNEYVRRYRALAIMLNGGKTDNLNSIMAGSTLPEWLVSLNTDTVLSDQDLGAEDYRWTWQKYFTSRSELLKAIEEAAKAKTDEALERLDDIGDDGKLDPSEKQTVRREFLSAWRERDAEGGILDRCTNTAGQYINDTIEDRYVKPYKTAFLAVATYLNGSNGAWKDTPYPVANQDDYIPLWLTTARKDRAEAIDGEAWRTKWSAFHTARTALLTALSEDAKDRADNAQDTANQKKRVFSTDANQLPPAPYDKGDMWVDAIWYTEENGVRTYRWTGDVLYCIYGRSANANRSISDWADAASGTTAKIANLGTQIEAEVKDRKNGTSSLLKLDPTSGSLTVNVYDEKTGLWTSIGNISMALVRENGGVFSKFNLTADNVEINADLLEVISREVRIEAAQVNFTATESFKAAVGNSGVILEGGLISAFTAALDSEDGEGVADMYTRLGMVIRKDGSNGEFTFGSWVEELVGSSYRAVWKAGLSFKTENGKTKLLLKADNVVINSDLIIDGNNVDFGGSLRSHVEQSIDSGLDNFTVLAKHIGFTAADLNITAGDVNFKTGNFKINNGSYDTLAVTAAGDITIRGTVNADSGYFKGELQGATGTFSGSLTSNDNKVLLTSTGVSGWGLSYTWRGFAVSNNGFTGGDLATIGARLNAGGYDYGRIALVKRPAGTSSSSSADVSVVLSADDGSVEASTLRVTTANVTALNARRLFLNYTAIGHALAKYTCETENTIFNPLSLGRDNIWIVNSTVSGSGVQLPELSYVRSALGIDSGTNFCARLIITADLGSNNFYIFGRNTRKDSSDNTPWNTSELPLMTHWDNGQWDRLEMGAGDTVEFLLIYDSSRTGKIDSFDTKYTARIINRQN